MKKLVLLLFAAGLFFSCNPETELSEQEQTACPAPDTNCNGIPDHEEGIGTGG